MFQKYIHSHKAKIKLKQSSISTYCRKFESYILPFFRQQEEISEKTVAEFTAHLQTSLADKTTADVLGLLSEILSCSGITLEIYKPAVYPPEIVIFPKTEWERLRDYCVSHLDYLTYGILVAMYTGIRPGELSGARCRHIDFHSAVFKVRFTMQRIKNLDHTEQKTKIIIDTPKSHKAIRDIPLVNDLLLLGKNLYQASPPDAFLLTGKTGRFIEPRLLEDKFTKIMQELNISGKNLYSLRHTFATDFYDKTHDVKSLSEILGHADIKTTLNRYVHPDAEKKRQGINALLS